MSKSPKEEVDFQDLKQNASEEAVRQHYIAFINRALDNEIGRKVKLKDIDDNLDVSRIASPTENDKRRLRRYKEAREFSRLERNKNAESEIIELITKMKSELLDEVAEWLGSDIPEENAEDYDDWQSRLMEIEDMRSFGDVKIILRIEEEMQESFSRSGKSSLMRN